jgi:tight adherence protein B
MSPLMILLAFFAGFFLIFAINYALADVTEAHRQRYQKRLEQELLKRRQAAVRASIARKDLQSLVAGMPEITSRPSLRERLVRLTNESGVEMRPDQLLVACACTGLTVFFPCIIIGQHWLLGTLLGLVAAPAPMLYLAFLRNQRRENILEQLPEAFELMSRTLRSGQTIAQAFQAVSDEARPPVSIEFGFCYEQQNLGLTPESAMRDLSRRTGLLELKIFVMAVMIHRQTGGNLTELLDKLSGVIRERLKIRGTIKALTAEGALQAYILLALPPGMLAILWMMNRPYAELLFQYYGFLIGAGFAMTLGYLWMRRIINFDF